MNVSGIRKKTVKFSASGAPSSHQNKLKRHIVMLTGGSLILLLSGCSTLSSWLAPKETPVAQTKHEVVVPAGPVRPHIAQEPTVDPVMASIAGSANEVAQYMKEIKSVTTASQLPNITPNQKQQMDLINAAVPAGLGARISVQYSGDVNNLLEAIAQAVGWKFTVQGVKSPIMQVVNKKYVETRAIDALKDIGYSVNGVSVVVDAAHKQIIMRYKI